MLPNNFLPLRLGVPQLQLDEYPDKYVKVIQFLQAQFYTLLL